MIVNVYVVKGDSEKILALPYSFGMSTLQCQSEAAKMLIAKDAEVKDATALEALDYPEVERVR